MCGFAEILMSLLKFYIYKAYYFLVHFIVCQYHGLFLIVRVSSMQTKQRNVICQFGTVLYLCLASLFDHSMQEV